MKRAVLSGALLGVSLIVMAAEFRAYPGATALDFAAWQRKHPNVKVPAGMHVERYTTPDPLDKVAAFYAATGKESDHREPLELATGERVHMRTFILDGAKTTAQSKLLVRVQRPYLDYITPELRGEGTKDLTAIELIRRD